MNTLAIIGTAGRGSDAARLTLPVWNDMKRGIHRFVLRHGFKSAVSGGSSFSDHLAVGLYNAGFLDSLMLALPCEFDWQAGKFVDKGEPFNPAARLTELHGAFSDVIGRNTIDEIKRAIYKGADVITADGFHARNTIVAAKADVLIALTFGRGATVLDGGTTDTCRKYLARGGRALWHVDLNDMSLHENGTVQS
jgi:hypothetical protein